MKLILAIVSHDDANGVIRALTHDGFSVTKLATTGGFLMAGTRPLSWALRITGLTRPLILSRRSLAVESKQSPPSQNLGYHFAHQCLLR